MVSEGTQNAETAASVKKPGVGSRPWRLGRNKPVRNSELRIPNFELQFYLLAISSMNANRSTGTSIIAA